MALHYDVRTVADEYKADGEQWRITEALIFVTMVVGINRITEDNATTFAERLAAYQKVRGALLSNYDGETVTERPVTAEDVRARIGLSTNATPMTNAAFKRRMADLLMEEVRG